MPKRNSRKAHRSIRRAESYLQTGPLGIKMLCVLFAQYQLHKLEGLVTRMHKIPKFRTDLQATHLFAPGSEMVLGIHHGTGNYQWIMNDKNVFTQSMSIRNEIVLASHVSWSMAKCFVTSVIQIWDNNANRYLFPLVFKCGILENDATITVTKEYLCRYQGVYVTH